MSGFKKRKYTIPVICKHDNNISKDWYIFFQFKHEGKVHSYKRREGVNRIKNLKLRIKEINKLLIEISYDLDIRWDPILDKKREHDYNPYLEPKSVTSKRNPKPKNDAYMRYYLK